MVKQICIEGAQSLVPGDKIFLFLFRRIGSSISLNPALNCPVPALCSREPLMPLLVCLLTDPLG